MRTSDAAPTRLRATVWPVTLPVGVGRAALLQHGSIVTLAGGLVLGDRTTDTVQPIDLADPSGKPHTTARLETPVHDTAGATVGDNSYVIGGGNASEQSAVQAKVGDGWKTVGHLPTTRSDLSAIGLAAGAGRIWVLGGYDGSTSAVASVLASSDGTSWQQAGALAVAVRYAATVLGPDGKVWLFGGEVSGTEKSVVQMWDPETGKGTVVAHLPMPLGHMSAVTVGDRVLLLGGRTDAGSGAMTDRMWWFDPVHHTVADAGRLPYPVADAAVAYWNGSVYVLGGESPHPIATILQIKVTP